MALGASVCYILYLLISQLYQYVTMVHHEPDEVLLLATLYGFGLALKCILAIYGFHFATVHTDRTPYNYRGLFKLINVIMFYNLVATLIIHMFLTHHLKAYSSQFG